MIIAIDGPAGAGKSTVARIIAHKLGFLYIDTGAMYRALTLKIMQEKIDIKDNQRIVKMAVSSRIELTNKADGSINVFLDGRDVSKEIREPRISQIVSDIAKIKEVREEMLKLQKKLGEQNNAVLDGRDIGTVVFPEADRKFYIDARVGERVKRRYKELKELGQDITMKDVDADLSKRDKIDSTRQYAPLKKAQDAIYIDTTHMTIEEVVNRIYQKLINKKKSITLSKVTSYIRLLL